jgi:hypothetical protein
MLELTETRLAAKACQNAVERLYFVFFSLTHRSHSSTLSFLKAGLLRVRSFGPGKGELDGHPEHGRGEFLVVDISLLIQ